jgi:hypothetical protein
VRIDTSSMCQGSVFSYYPLGEIESRHCAVAPWIKGSLGIIHSTSQLEFCPDCFPLADSRSALPEDNLYKHYHGTGGEENRGWADLDPEADFWFASDVRNRAELFNAAVPHDEDIRLFVAVDSPTLDGRVERSSRTWFDSSSGISGRDWTKGLTHPIFPLMFSESMSGPPLPKFTHRGRIVDQ